MKIILSIILLIFQQATQLNGQTVLNSCNKTEFAEKFMNKDVIPGDGTTKLMKETCSAVQNLRCQKADFDLTYMRNEMQDYYYFITVANLRNINRKDCWGYLLIIKSANTVQQYYIKTDRENSEMFMKYLQVEAEQLYKISLQTFPTFESVSIHVKAPGECENEVLQEILRQREQLGPVACKVPPSLLEITALAKLICLSYPDSKLNRLSTISKSISKVNCSVLYRSPIHKSQTDEWRRGQSSPLILIIPLILTIVCLLAVAFLILVKIYTRTNFFRGRRVELLTLRKRRVGSHNNDNENNKDEQKNNDDVFLNDDAAGAQALVTDEPMFRSYESV